MSLQEEVDRALKEHSAGRLAEAEAIYRKILKQNPNFPPALHLLGVVVSQQGDKRGAIEFISRAIALSPNVADFHSNLALAYCENQEPDKAVASCKRALALQPDHAGAHNHFGIALKGLGKLEDSVDCFKNALALQPEMPVVLENMADSLRRLGRIAEADEVQDRLVALQPNDPSGLCARGEKLLGRSRFDDAAKLFRSIIESHPQDWRGHNGLGVALNRKGEFEQAIACYQKAIELAPDNPGPWNNLGFARVEQGMTDDGIAGYQTAIKLRPDFADAYNNLGNALLQQRELTKALNCYDRALYFQPDHADAHWNRSLLLLHMGDFEQGWLQYEWRWLKFPEQRRHFREPKWDGFEIKGKTILVHSEQGFGDAIQFVRLVPLVAKQGAAVNLECQRELVGLMQHIPGVARTFCRGDPLPPFDVHCPLLSLPHVLGVSLKTNPTPVPYLAANPALVERWRQRVPIARFKVGLVWAGSTVFKKNVMRSPMLGAFEPLANIPGTWFCSLQKGEFAKDSRNAPAGMELVDWTGELHDFADTAALIENLDLVIASDTAVVHLVGALGKPVWVVLHYSPDWRWRLEGTEVAWYPSMRLFRQPRPGEWANVMQEVAGELKRHVDRAGA